MKNLVFFLSFFMLVYSGCRNAEKEQAGELQEAEQAINPDNVIVLEMDVEGMTCTGCENTIKEGVSELPGIVNINASWKAGKAYVEFDSTITTEKDISRIMEQRGYHVTSFRKAQYDELMLENENEQE